MKILITGGNGFIGRSLKEYLSGVYEVLAPSSKELDLRDENFVCDYLTQNRFDIILHSAVLYEHKAGGTADMVLDTNLRMFFNLAKHNNLYGRMIHFGSGAEYDMRYYKPLMGEDYFGNHIPVDKYGFAKYIISKSIIGTGNIYCLRLFGVFGINEDYTRRFISNSICKALNGKQITINQNMYFDYLYIRDLLRIVEWFFTASPIYRHYNVCTSTPVDLLNLARIIKSVSGNEHEILVKNEGLKPDYTGSNSRLMAELGLFEFTKADEAIAELYMIYKKLATSHNYFVC